MRTQSIVDIDGAEVRRGLAFEPVARLQHLDEVCEPIQSTVLTLAPPLRDRDDRQKRGQCDAEAFADKGDLQYALHSTSPSATAAGPPVLP